MEVIPEKGMAIPENCEGELMLTFLSPRVARNPYRRNSVEPVMAVSSVVHDNHMPARPLVDNHNPAGMPFIE
jgi:hypothetical protein